MNHIYLIINAKNPHYFRTNPVQIRVRWYFRAFFVRKYGKCGIVQKECRLNNLNIN